MIHDTSNDNSDVHDSEIGPKKFHPNKKSFASKNSKHLLCVDCPHFPIKRAIFEQL